MKLKVLSLALGLGAIALTSCNKMASNPSLTNQLDSVSYCIGSTFGANLERSGISEADFNEDIFRAAFKAAMNKDSLKIDIKDANKIIGDYMQAKREEKAESNVQAGKDYLEANKSKEGVQVTASGLQYSVMTEGTGVKPLATDKVKVHYHGTTIDGKVFDSSVDRGTPAEFPLNRVIKGWTEGVQLMSVGSKYKFVIPSELAYGARGAGADIGPNSTLIFEVELLEIIKEEVVANK